MRTVSHSGHREALQLLHIKLYQNISNSDFGVVHQLFERPICEAYFHYCAKDLISATYFFPEDMIIAFFKFLSDQIDTAQRDIGSSGVEKGPTQSSRHMICRLACVEGHNSALLNVSDDYNIAHRRYDVISECLRSLCCWHAALLFDAGYSHALGVTYTLKSDHINLALSHLINPNSPYDLEVFEYLDSLIKILSGEISDFTGRCHIDIEPKRSTYPLFQCSSGLIDPTMIPEIRNILSDYIIKLAQISLTETKKLILLTYKEDIPALISATENCRSTQLELMTTMLDGVMDNNWSDDKLYFPTVSHTTFLKYISLLQSENPAKIHPFLTRCTAIGYQFPLRECLLLLTSSTYDNLGNKSSFLPNAEGREEKAWRSLDAVALLKDFSSDLKGSLAAILLFIRCAVFDEISDGKEYNDYGSRQRTSDNSAVIDGVQHLILLCTKERSRQMSPILETSAFSDESIWYTALDSLICIPGTCNFVMSIDILI